MRTTTSISRITWTTAVRPLPTSASRSSKSTMAIRLNNQFQTTGCRRETVCIFFYPARTIQGPTYSCRHQEVSWPPVFIRMFHGFTLFPPLSSICVKSCFSVYSLQIPGFSCFRYGSTAFPSELRMMIGFYRHQCRKCIKKTMHMYLHLHCFCHKNAYASYK